MERSLGDQVLFLHTEGPNHVAQDNAQETCMSQTGTQQYRTQRCKTGCGHPLAQSPCSTWRSAGANPDPLLGQGVLGLIKRMGMYTPMIDTDLFLILERLGDYETVDQAQAGMLLLAWIVAHDLLEIELRVAQRQGQARAVPLEARLRMLNHALARD